MRRSASLHDNRSGHVSNVSLQGARPSSERRRQMLIQQRSLRAQSDHIRPQAPRGCPGQQDAVNMAKHRRLLLDRPTSKVVRPFELGKQALHLSPERVGARGRRFHVENPPAMATSTRICGVIWIMGATRRRRPRSRRRPRALRNPDGRSPGVPRCRTSQPPCQQV